MWRSEGGNLTTTNVKSIQPFNDIFHGIENNFPEDPFERINLLKK